MRKIVWGAVLAGVLGAGLIAVLPAHVELTLAPVQDHHAVVSGWISSGGESRHMLEEQVTPWEARLRADELEGFVQAPEGSPVRLRARMYKGPVPISVLTLAGTRLSFEATAHRFSGRAR